MTPLGMAIGLGAQGGLVRLLYLLLSFFQFVEDLEEMLMIVND